MDAQRRLFTSRLPKVKAETDAYQAQQRRSQAAAASAAAAATAAQQSQMQAPTACAEPTTSVAVGWDREQGDEAREGDGGQEGDEQPLSFEHLPMRFLDEDLDPEEGPNIYDVHGNIAKARAAAAAAARLAAAPPAATASTAFAATAAVPRYYSAPNNTPDAGGSTFAPTRGGPESSVVLRGGGGRGTGEGSGRAAVPAADTTVVAVQANSAPAAPPQQQVQQQQQRRETASSMPLPGPAVHSPSPATAVGGAAVGTTSSVAVAGQAPPAPPRQAKLEFRPRQTLPAAIATDGWGTRETEGLPSAWADDGGPVHVSATPGDRGADSDAAARALREAEEQAEMLEEDNLITDDFGGGGGWWSEPPRD